MVITWPCVFVPLTTKEYKIYNVKTEYGNSLSYSTGDGSRFSLKEIIRHFVICRVGKTSRCYLR